MEFRDVLQPTSREKRSAYEAVKIAILDTGIQQDLYDSFKDPESPGAFKYEDFVDAARPDMDTTSDGTGHGSAAVLLVERMCPYVNYYVARVLKTNVATRSDVGSIVKVRIPLPRSDHSGSIADHMDRVLTGLYCKE